MVTVFGLGFVGLTTALGLAEKGYKVYGLDINIDRKNTIRDGNLPFLEPGLDVALVKNLNNNFSVTDDINEAIRNSEYVFYCVGTPYGDNGEADLKYLFSAIDQTLSAINDNKFRVLITKSTIPPSTTSKKIVNYVVSKGVKVGVDLGIANNPEFLREGVCWDDFMNPDRIVIGTNDNTSKEMLEKLYQPFNTPILNVSHNTAEFIKYLSNTLLATMISYSNEMSIIADTIGDIEVSKAFKILHMDKRWGNSKMTSYVYPGCGYGGYCLPKDTNAIYALSRNLGFDAPVLKNVIEINDNMPKIIVGRLNKIAKKHNHIGILGLSFKPNSDDVRDTPAAKIILEMQEQGYTNISGYDPVANNEFSNHYSTLKMDFKTDLSSLISSSDVFILVTAWGVFENFKDMTNKPIIDGRYMFTDQ